MSSDHDSHPGAPLLLQRATLVANLKGWSGGILGQPWYNWLSPDDILLTGGNSVSESFEGIGKPENNAGREGVLYRLPVQSGADEKALLARQRPQALVAMSRRISEYGRFACGNASASPDGRWLLYVGTRPVKAGNGVRDNLSREVLKAFYWCAVRLDGSRNVAWAMRVRPPETIDATGRAYVKLSQASWLPDSGGILETETDWESNRTHVVVNGQVRLLESPEAPLPLPTVHLGTLLRNSASFPDVSPARMVSMSDGTTIALHCDGWTPDDRSLSQSHGRPSDLPADRIIVYRWKWDSRSQATPQVRTGNMAISPGYNVIGTSLSRSGDRVAWVAMDRPHYAVVRSGVALHRRFGAARAGLWVSKTGDSDGGQEIGRIPIPLHQEMEWRQLFGLGNWLRGDRRLSFNVGGLLYTVPVP